MTNGFQRDVTFNLDAGPVQQPTQGSNLAALGTIASVVAGEFKQRSLNKQEQEAMDLVDKASDVHRNIISQGGSISQAQRAASEIFRNNASNLAIRKQAMSLFASQTGTTADRELIRETMTSRERELVRVQSEKMEAASFVDSQVQNNPELKGKLIEKFGRGAWESKLRNTASEQELEDMKVFVDNEMMKKQIAELDAQRLHTTKDKGESLMVARHLESYRKSQVTDMLSIGMSAVLELPMGVDKVKHVSNLKTEGLFLIGQAKADVEKTWDLATRNLTMSNSDKALREAADKEKEKALKYYTGLETSLEKLSENELTELARTKNAMRDKSNIDALELLGPAATLKDLLGETQVSNMLAARGGQTMIKIGDQWAKAMAQFASTDGKVDLSLVEKTLQDGFNVDKNIIDENDPAKRKAMVDSFYSFFYTNVKEGLAKDWTPSATRNGTDQVIKILHAASGTRDAKEQEKALHLLNDDGEFKTFYKNLDADQKAEIDRMRANFNADVLTDQNIGIRPDLEAKGVKALVIYNSDKGTLELKNQGSSETNVLSVSGALGAARKATRPTEVMKKFNRHVDKIVESKESHPFFKDMERKEIADFLVQSLGLEGLDVKGTMTDFTEEHAEAYVREVPVDAIMEERKARIKDSSKFAIDSIESIKQLRNDMIEGRITNPEVQKAFEELMNYIQPAQPASNQSDEVTAAVQNAETEEEAVEIVRQLRGMHRKEKSSEKTSEPKVKEAVKKLKDKGLSKEEVREALSNLPLADNFIKQHLDTQLDIAFNESE